MLGSVYIYIVLNTLYPLYFAWFYLLGLIARFFTRLYVSEVLVKVLLTGASGFVGKAVLKAAQQRGFEIRPVFRSLDSAAGQFRAVLVPALDAESDWTEALQSVDVVIHTAGRTPSSMQGGDDSLGEYLRINAEGTLNLAVQAAKSGVRRFVFVSSIKVNGESTAIGTPFTAEDTPSPEDYYGISKATAESELKELALETGMEVTVIRPSLIYGPGVKGNLASLISCVRREMPLPLGDVTHNRRSLVGLDNLVDLILICCNHPNAANQVFLVSDGEDLSTTELVRKIGRALGRQVRLFWLPTSIISLLASMLGKKAASQRLLGSLQVDIKKTRELLDWNPSVSVDDGLRRTVE